MAKLIIYPVITDEIKNKIIEIFKNDKDNRTTTIAKKLNQPLSRINTVINCYLKSLSLS